MSGIVSEDLIAEVLSSAVKQETQEAKTEAAPPEAPPAPVATEQDKEIPEPVKAEDKVEPVTEAKEEAKAPNLYEKLEAERKARAKELEVQRQKAALESELSDLRAKAARAEKLEKLAKENKLQLLNELGTDVDQLAREQLTKGKPDPNARLLEELNQIKSKLAEQDKALLQREYERQVQEAKQYISSYVEKAGDKYELIRAFEAQDMVWEAHQKHFNETGEPLSDDDACGYVEAYLESIAEKALKSNKIKAKFSSKPSETTKERNPQTLTNTMASTVPIRKESAVEDDYDWKDIDQRVEAVLKKQKTF